MYAAPQSLLTFLQPFFDGLQTVTGGWDNLLQGALGSALGVLGAFWIALFVFKREASQAMRMARETSAVQAAGVALQSLARVTARFKRIQEAQPASGEFGYGYFEQWEERVQQFQDDVSVVGPLLPRRLEDDLVGLVPLLGGAMIADFDDDGVPVLVVKGKDATLATIAENIATVQKALQDYRRTPSDPRAEDGASLNP